MLSTSQSSRSPVTAGSLEGDLSWSIHAEEALVCLCLSHLACFEGWRLSEVLFSTIQDAKVQSEGDGMDTQEIVLETCTQKVFMCPS